MRLAALLELTHGRREFVLPEWACEFEIVEDPDVTLLLNLNAVCECEETKHTLIVFPMSEFLSLEFVEEEDNDAA